MSGKARQEAPCAPARCQRRHAPDWYDVRDMIRTTLRAAVAGCGAYTSVMAGLWLGAHR